jgi:hypothetical protein
MEECGILPNDTKGGKRGRGKNDAGGHDSRSEYNSREFKELRSDE